MKNQNVKTNVSRTPAYAFAFLGFYEATLSYDFAGSPVKEPCKVFYNTKTRDIMYITSRIHYVEKDTGNPIDRRMTDIFLENIYAYGSVNCELCTYCDDDGNPIIPDLVGTKQWLYARLPSNTANNPNATATLITVTKN